MGSTWFEQVEYERANLERIADRLNELNQEFIRRGGEEREAFNLEEASLCISLDRAFFSCITGMTALADVKEYWLQNFAGSRVPEGPIPSNEMYVALQDYKCGICGERLGVDDEIHMDHIVPVSQGGKSVASNMQAAHPACNMKKGGAMPEDLPDKRWPPESNTQKTKPKAPPRRRHNW